MFKCEHCGCYDKSEAVYAVKNMNIFLTASHCGSKCFLCSTFSSFLSLGFPFFPDVSVVRYFLADLMKVRRECLFGCRHRMRFCSRNREAEKAPALVGAECVFAIVDDVFVALLADERLSALAAFHKMPKLKVAQSVRRRCV